jgi:two-component system LytT family response regulator
VVAVDEIDWIRADGNYVQIHANGTRYLHRETLSHLLAALDPARFLRIHRGVIVNVERIREVHPLFKGGAEVVLHDGTRLDLSRRFRAGARVALGLP